MKQVFVGFIWLSLCFISIYSQSNKKVSLLVKNCEETENACRTVHLFRYDFVNGEYVGKEKIITSPSNEVIYDGWRDKIYQNRYVLTRSGDVIDVLEKKILYDGDGELHRIDGDKIFIRKLNHQFKNGLYVFDLATKKYDLVRKIDDNMTWGELSPNGIRSARHFCSINDVCGIEISERGGKKKFFKGTFTTITSRDFSSSELMEIPIIWLDDERFLTQTANGKLVIITAKGMMTPLLQIKIDKYPGSNPTFYRNNDGEIIYDCVNKFMIDVEGKSFKKFEDEYLDKGFSAKDDEWVKGTFGINKTFFLDGKEIGRIWANHPVAATDFLAVEYGEYGSNLAYPKGVKVWNNIKKDWTTIEIKWGVKIIGWIEN